MKQVAHHLVAAIRDKTPDLGSAVLGAEYSYHSLPLCVIDAVFSIGVHYTNARKAVEAWCAAQNPNWPLYASARIPRQTISDFVRVTEGIDGDATAIRFFGGNRQRTSSRGGILKAEATLLFARALQEAGIEDFEDLQNDTRTKLAWQAVRDIPGQGSGRSFDYFMMLGGDDSCVKPDRMVCRFVALAAGLPAVSPAIARAAVLEASRTLANDFPNITPRLLDYLIWSYQRNQSKVETGEAAR